MVMADRGFTVEEELASRGATLKIPAFTKNKKQMPAKDVYIIPIKYLMFAFTWNVLLVGQKKFKLLNSIIPIKMVDLLDSVMVVICVLVNLNNSVVG